MANVFIEESILQGWADTVREKTGTTDKMLPSALLQQTQENWGTGGGSTDLVKYVTFLNEDGTTLYQMPVLVGDDCKDPVTRGDISKPEKEDTNTIDYTYSGWTSTVGGVADANILKNITEDKTVYAAYTESVRYYTVTFYDGETLLETVQVTYGGTATPTETPTKDDYMFGGWQPSNENITADTACYAQWTESAEFATASWATIARISESGQAQNVFKHGDTKTVAFGDETVTLKIIGFGKDVDSDGNPIGLTIGFYDIPSTCKSRISTTNDTAVKNYAGSYVKTYLASTAFTSNLPSDLVSVVKTTRKLINAGYKSGGNTSTSTVDVKFFPFSTSELATKGSTDVYLGVSYGLYAQAYLSGTTTAVKYLARDLVHNFTSYRPVYIDENGGRTVSTAVTATTEINLRVGFCI